MVLCTISKLTRIFQSTEYPANIYISPMNHGSNRSERYIRTLNDIITKCLVGTGSYWPLYIAPAMFAMNCQVSQVTGLSPFQMVYSKPPPDKLAFDFDPINSGIKLDTKLYMLCMQQQKLLIDSSGLYCDHCEITNHEILNCFKLQNTLKRKGVALNEVNRKSLSELEKHQMIMELKAYIDGQDPTN